MESSIKKTRGEGWFRLEDQANDVAISVHRTAKGGYVCHLDFDLDPDAHAMHCATVHFLEDCLDDERDVGMVEVSMDYGDIEVYASDAMTFMAAVRRLLGRAQKMLLDDAADYHGSWS